LPKEKEQTTIYKTYT